MRLKTGDRRKQGTGESMKRKEKQVKSQKLNLNCMKGENRNPSILSSGPKGWKLENEK